MNVTTWTLCKGFTVQLSTPFLKVNLLQTGYLLKMLRIFIYYITIIVIIIDLYHWYDTTDFTAYIVPHPGVLLLDPSVNLTVTFKIIPHTEISPQELVFNLLLTVSNNQHTKFFLKANSKLKIVDTYLLAQSGMLWKAASWSGWLGTAASA